MYLELIGLYVYSYLAGSIPTPYIIAKVVKGIDLRQYGSGNVGGSNVIQQLGKGWVAPLALVEFLLKGLSPVVLGFILRASPLFLIAPLLALAGNNWSVFLRFQGGRGLMVVCGMLIALVPLLFVIGIAVYLIGWRISRSSAVWALTAVGLLPIIAFVTGGYLVVDWLGLLAGLSGETLTPVPLGEVVGISWFCLVILVIVILKRTLSNSMAFPMEMSKRKVLFNRVFRDRDFDDRTAWLSRGPE
ncbi:Glycerol-3-phosphate acyltransferase 4 [Geodia barretti]|uniref:Glycerol-3-phosphate acyltransferase 4 n=1 Tax=Geodia barretti TaxID=519541 RepID=A0AA35WBD2_GEOBA|nr:Glycerol-3-phosphate acyltransferase 4 [Geodia barretti]